MQGMKNTQGTWYTGFKVHTRHTAHAGYEKHAGHVVYRV
jgi:hypothetical protein